MKSEELLFIGQMYDQWYNGWHVSEQDAIRFQNIVARLKEASDKLIKTTEV